MGGNGTVSSSGGAAGGSSSLAAGRQCQHGWLDFRWLDRWREQQHEQRRSSATKGGSATSGGASTGGTTVGGTTVAGTTTGGATKGGSTTTTGAGGVPTPGGSTTTSGVGGVTTTGGASSTVAATSTLSCDVITCTGGKVCASGVCQCPTGSTLCGGVCLAPADLQTDPAHCGTTGCGVACGTGATCSAGVCSCTTAGQTACTGDAPTYNRSHELRQVRYGLRQRDLYGGGLSTGERLLPEDHFGFSLLVNFDTYDGRIQSRIGFLPSTLPQVRPMLSTQAFMSTTMLPALRSCPCPHLGPTPANTR